MKGRFIMEKLFNWITVLIGLIGGVSVKLLGAWDTMLMVFIAVMVIDYVTGIIKGIYNRELSSQTGWKGLLKKVATLCIVIVANLLEKLTGGNIGIRDIVIMFYIANEGLSILENVAAMGNIIPQPLKDVLLQLREKNGGKS